MDLAPSGLDFRLCIRRPMTLVSYLLLALVVRPCRTVSQCGTVSLKPLLRAGLDTGCLIVLSLHAGGRRRRAGHVTGLDLHDAIRRQHTQIPAPMWTMPVVSPNTGRTTLACPWSCTFNNGRHPPSNHSRSSPEGRPAASDTRHRRKRLHSSR